MLNLVWFTIEFLFLFIYLFNFFLLGSIYYYFSFDFFNIVISIT